VNIYVLISERGEYEQFTREILGVFSSEPSARAAIQKFQELGKAQWVLYQEYEKREEEYLTKFEPSEVFPPGSPFPDGCVLYTNEQYEEANKVLGPKPALICDGDNYVVECFTLDAIEAHS
jgi:hypothetical protein